MESSWIRDNQTPSLPEVHSTISVPSDGKFFRTLVAYWGPGLLIAVGYMDPGNWATDLAGGSKFGFTLLSVVLISNLMAMLLQHLSLKLGIVSGRDLAQACRDSYSKPTTIFLWVICEIAIAACDLAEVIGSAIALNLLFGIPLPVGVFITAIDVMLILYLQHKGFRLIEAIVGALIVIIGACFIYEMWIARPSLEGIAAGLVPSSQIILNPEMLYVAIGILGATVMPHNLYLHSSIVQTRAYERTEKGIKTAVKFATIDSTLALGIAFFINAAILILSAATFHGTPHGDVADINDAYKLLTPILNDHWASTLFAIALLAAGQNSTLTGTMAGQIVMEGFLNFRMRPWLRRLVTRLVAIVPAATVAIIYGEKGVGELLVLSQVILSMQLSFAVVPLVLFTSSKGKMGQFVNSKGIIFISSLVAAVIMILNLYLLWETFF